MGHRDDREAERARIESLERDLAEANERAQRAEAEAVRARAGAASARREAQAEAARQLEARATKAAPKSRAERKRDERERDAETRTVGAGAWSHENRRRYFLASVTLSLLAYGTTAAVMFGQPDTGDGVVTPDVFYAGLAALAALVFGHVVIARATEAPGVVNGALNTLLGCAVSLACGMTLVILASSLDTIAPPMVLAAARWLAVAVAVVGGALVTAYWSCDAATSDTTLSP